MSESTTAVPVFEYVSIKDTTTGWPEVSGQDYGFIPGFLRGYNVEFKHKETGSIEYGTAIYVPTTVEEYYQRDIDEWGELGYSLFQVERSKGFEPTGRVVFRGYNTELYDPDMREEYVEDAVKEVAQLMEERGHVFKIEIDPHKSAWLNLSGTTDDKGDEKEMDEYTFHLRTKDGEWYTGIGYGIDRDSAYNNMLEKTSPDVSVFTQEDMLIEKRNKYRVIVRSDVSAERSRWSHSNDGANAQQHFGRKEPGEMIQVYEGSNLISESRWSENMKQYDQTFAPRDIVGELNPNNGFDYSDVPIKYASAVRQELSKNGYSLVAMIHRSNHPADSYLFDLIAAKDNDPFGENRFAKWMFNGSTGSMNHGHYNQTLDMAMDKVREITWDVSMAAHEGTPSVSQEKPSTAVMPNR